MILEILLGKGRRYRVLGVAHRTTAWCKSLFWSV